MVPTELWASAPPFTAGGEGRFRSLGRTVLLLDVLPNNSANLHYVQLRYNFRIEPSPGQVIALSKAFGCARVVFNDALAERQAAFAEGLPFITDAELSRRLTRSKRQPDRAWLADVSAGRIATSTCRLKHGLPQFLCIEVRQT